jgi:hypothetical protein
VSQLAIDSLAVANLNSSVAAGAGFGGQISCQPSTNLGSYSTSDTPTFTFQQSFLKILRDPALKKYAPLVRSFVEYLRMIDNRKMFVSGYNVRSGAFVTYPMGYRTRWSRERVQAFVAKLYQLKEWHDVAQCPITMMSCTTYQAGEYSASVKGHPLTMHEAWELMRTSRLKILKILRKYMPHVDYFWWVEPHQSGYPHAHILIFGDVTPELQEKIHLLWTNKYGAGSLEHGIEFSFNQKGSGIKNLINYLLKYMTKTIPRGGSWSPSVLIFHAHVWDGNYRLFGTSAHLTKIMQWDKERDTDIVWLKCSMLTPPSDSCEEIPSLIIAYERLYIPDWLDTWRSLKPSPFEWTTTNYPRKTALYVVPDNYEMIHRKRFERYKKGL